MADRYWVGGTGSWDSTSKWSASSGGSSGASVPTSSDNVIFDANSGSAHYTVTVTSGATCANFTFTPKAINGATNFVFQGTLTIAGSFSTSGTQGNRRAVFYSSVTGTQRTLSIASIGSVSDVDFQDISVTGAGGTLSGTRIGNRGNCTNITFSTPKSVYWVTSSNANWSGDNWSASSGGSASTNSFPLPQDTAVFDSNFLPITANEVYIDDAMQNGLAIGSFLSSRTALFYIKVRSGQVQSAQVYGDWNNSGGAATFSGPSANGYLEFVSSGTQTLFSAGPWPPIQVSCAPGGTVQLSRNFLSYSDINVAKGTFTTQNYDVSVNSLTSSSANTRTINLGSSTVNLSSYEPIYFFDTGLTFNAGTSTINFTNSASGATVYLGNQTFYNVNFTGTGTSTAHRVSGTNTFTNLSFSAPASAGLIPVSLTANQTITGTLTCSGATAIRRLFIFSSVYGTTRTLTVNSLSATDCDFRNITVAGSAAGSSQTRAGDCGGNNGITFDAPKTVYWNLSGSQNWEANGWASSSGGSPAVNNFPLAQDVAAFDNAGSAGTVTINYSWNIGSINASARTNAMTMVVGTTTIPALLYKDLTLGTGLTINGSGLNGFQFIGQGITQNITCNGSSVGCFIYIGGSAYSNSSSIRTVRFADTFSCSYSSSSGDSLMLYQGTLDTNSQNASFAGRVNINSGTVATLGSSTITCNGSFFASSYGTSVSGSGAIIKMNSSVSRDFSGGGLVYSGITLDKSGSGTLNIYGNNTFDNITNTRNLVGSSTITFESGKTNTFLNWNANGAVGRLLTINASSSTNATISKASGTVSAYYLSISKSTATGGATWIAYDSVNGGGNTGWNFTALQGGMIVFFL